MKSRNPREAFAGVFWLAAAFAIAMATVPSPPALFGAGDKVQHMAAFAVLSLLAALAFPRPGGLELFAAMAALGAMIEVLRMIPTLGRDADVGDWIADCVVFAVTLGILFFARKLEGSGTPSPADPS